MAETIVCFVDVPRKQPTMGIAFKIHWAIFHNLGSNNHGSDKNWLLSGASQLQFEAIRSRLTSVSMAAAAAG